MPTKTARQSFENLPRSFFTHLFMLQRRSR
jgi:hypothetical protein